MSDRGDSEFVGDMLIAITSILEYTEGITYADFLDDNKTKDAVIRNFQVLGESAKGVSEGFRCKHPQIPWKNLARVRDRLVHQYFGVNYEIIWAITKDRLPEVLRELKKL